MKSGFKKHGHRSHTSWRRMAKNHELVQLLRDQAEKLNKEIIKNAEKVPTKNKSNAESI